MHVYDSVYEEVDDDTHTVIQNLLGPDRVRISMVEMQKQRGPDDCGLFAIAVATSLVHGAGLCTFRQDQMRRHVLGCFEEKLLCVFPTVHS